MGAWMGAWMGARMDDHHFINVITRCGFLLCGGMGA